MAEKGEDFADLIKSHTRMDWELMMKDMHEISTGELIEGLTALGLYVNKNFAQEIAGKEDAVFHFRRLIHALAGYYQIQGL